MFLHAQQPGPDQFVVFDVESPASLLGAQPVHFPFTNFGSKRSEVCQRDAQAQIRGNDLDRPSIHQGKGGPQRLVPPHDLVERALHQSWIDRAFQNPAKRSVIRRIARIGPVRMPHPLLHRRKRKCEQLVFVNVRVRA